jgi:hypothetical protein
VCHPLSQDLLGSNLGYCSLVDPISLKNSIRCPKGQAEELLVQTLRALEGYEAPVAEWRLFATAGRLYERLHQRAKANRSWAHSTDILTRLAESLVKVPELYQSFLSLSSVQDILSRARANR